MSAVHGLCFYPSWFLLEVLEEEELAKNAERMGRILEQELSTLDPQIVTTIRGRGLFWAIVIKETPGIIENESPDRLALNAHAYLEGSFILNYGLGLFVVVSDMNAWKVAYSLRDQGLLCKPTHDHILRLAPPLVITEEQIREACDIIKTTINS